MIAPIVITVILVIYYILYFTLIIQLINSVWSIVLGVVPLILSAITIGVCVERIKEIKKGEEDDLSNY